MNSVMVIVEYDSGSKRQRFILPADVYCDRLSTTIAHRLELPIENPEGRQAEYRLLHKGTGRELSRTKTLKAARVKENDVLQLEPREHSDWRAVVLVVLVLLLALCVAAVLL